MQSGTFMEHHPKSPVVEAFRTLRTNLQFLDFEGHLKSLGITSALPGEGKSTVAANLAVAIAQAGRSAVLVDADLRRPELHRIFGVANRVGLTNLLVDGAGEEALQSTKVDGLRLLTSGPLPPNPAELLSSPEMERVIALLGSSADVVIYDTPPATAVTDAAVLGAKIDGMLLVLRLGKAPRDAVMRAKKLLENANVRVLGVVANGDC